MLGKKREGLEWRTRAGRGQGGVWNGGRTGTEELMGTMSGGRKEGKREALSIVA